jgi:hypothetical protein
MNILWLIEKYIFSDNNIEKLKNALKENNNSFKEIEFFNNQISRFSIPENTFVIPYGSMEFIQYCQNKFSGIWSNEYFDEQTVLNNINEHYINHDSVVINFQEIENYVEKSNIVPFFIKPNKDNKEFAGKLFNSIQEFIEWKNNLIDIGYIQNIDFEVIFSKTKNILGEFCITVVNQQIISITSYGKEHNLNEKQAINFVEQMINMFNPSDVYVIDVGLVDNQWKVIEYNVVNSADMYNGDIFNIVKSITEFIDK